jgi:hypothetical protein
VACCGVSILSAIVGSRCSDGNSGDAVGEGTGLLDGDCSRRIVVLRYIVQHSHPRAQILQLDTLCT